MLGRRFGQWVILGLCVLGLIIGIASCNQVGQNASLPEVAALPLPTLPDWIEQISPTSTGDSLTQIRIRFKDPRDRKSVV